MFGFLLNQSSLSLPGRIRSPRSARRRERAHRPGVALAGGRGEAPRGGRCCLMLFVGTKGVQEVGYVVRNCSEVHKFCLFSRGLSTGREASATHQCLIGWTHLRSVCVPVFVDGMEVLKQHSHSDGEVRLKDDVPLQSECYVVLETFWTMVLSHHGASSLTLCGLPGNKASSPSSLQVVIQPGRRHFSIQFWTCMRWFG